MSKQIKLNRDLSPTDFPWLSRPYIKGEIVYLYNGVTYGCIGHNGIAVSEVENETPFFEIPRDAVE